MANANGVTLRLITLGGIIQSIKVPDRSGRVDDVVLGHDSLDEYLGDPYYLGALIGRYANRIAHGRFTLEGRECVLAQNDGSNHLHGGPRGFHRAVWGADAFSNQAGSGVELRYTSASGEEGYPGTLEVRVTYTLTQRDELVIDYFAVTDGVTHVNLTQHTYFNLAGHSCGDVTQHELTLGASRFVVVDQHLIPTGEARPVAGTPFDFSSSTPVGQRIYADDGQLRHAGGYDHCYVLDQGAGDTLVFAARLYEPQSSRVLEIHTTEPGLQVYSGNSLGAQFRGKAGCTYGRRSGLALESQHLPNSPNEPRFPSTILRPGAEFKSRTVFRFSVRQ